MDDAGADIVGTRSLLSAIEGTIATHGDRPFIRTPDGREVTYTRFGVFKDAIASRFADAGIVQGDRVLVRLTTTPETVATLFALYRLGAVAVMPNLATTPAEMTRLAERTGAKLALLAADLADDARHLEQHSSVHAAVNGSGAWPALELDAVGAPLPEVNVNPDTPATTIFTSGTTGIPKAVTYTHGNHLFAGEITARRTGLTADDLFMHHFPLFHMNGLGQLMSVLVTGASMLLLERFRSGVFDGLLDAFQPTVTNLNSTHIKMIRATGTALGQPSSLRAVCLGLRLGDEDYIWFEQKYGCRLIHGYGLTESVTACISEPATGGRRGSSGIPSLGYRIRIGREDGTECDANQTGEIQVSCYTRHGLMRGYDGDDAGTAEVLRDGWLHTGDVAYRDEQGFVFWVDREKDIIKRAGENISPREIELVLEQHDEVIEAAVIGVVDPIRDQVPVAYVRLHDTVDRTVTLKHLEHLCGTQLAKFKLPAEIRVLDAFPHNAVGKVEKRRLPTAPVGAAY